MCRPSRRRLAKRKGCTGGGGTRLRRETHLASRRRTEETRNSRQSPARKFLTDFLPADNPYVACCPFRRSCPHSSERRGPVRCKKSRRHFGGAASWSGQA